VPSRKLSDSDYRCLFAFRHELRLFLAFSEEQAQRLGVTPQQHQVLLAVRARAPEAPAISLLAEQLVLKHHSVVELVDRLEQRRLLRRSRSENDARVACVHLTTRGEALLGKLTLLHRAELARRAPRLVTTLQKLATQKPALAAASARSARKLGKKS